NNSNVVSLSAVYNSGPLMAGYVYTRNAIAQTTNANDTVNGFGAVVTAGATAVNGTQTNTGLVATYDLGVAKVGYLNGRQTSTAGVGTANNTMAVNVPLGQATLQLVTGRTTSSDNSVDRRSTLVGAKYMLSKRTTAYIYSGSDENAGTAATALDKDSRAMVGINHTF
ncbi:MAG: Gram-negative porin, partial [Pseudomonadota bacterium]